MSTVVDTNVLLTANGMATQMSELCRIKCLNQLEQLRSNGTVVVDRQFLILGEYQNKLDPNRRPPGPGDAFVKHLLQNMSNSARVAQVTLTPTDSLRTDFKEFPDDTLLRNAFDPSDRKFVAASHAHPDKPPIFQAADSKWIGWEQQLLTHGIRVEFLCKDELGRIHARKTAAS
jgi:hypothetical protein